MQGINEWSATDSLDVIIDRFHPLFGHVLVVYTRSRGSVADHAPETILKTNLESIVCKVVHLYLV
jgi:hypothetical protein